MLQTIPAPKPGTPELAVWALLEVRVKMGLKTGATGSPLQKQLVTHTDFKT